MRNTLARKFRDEALTLTIAEDFEKLCEREKRNRGFGHKFWAMYHFDDESMIEYHVYEDGFKIWVYNDARAMTRACPKIVEFSQPPTAKFLEPVPGCYEDEEIPHVNDKDD